MLCARNHFYGSIACSQKMHESTMCDCIQKKEKKNQATCTICKSVIYIFCVLFCHVVTSVKDQSVSERSLMVQTAYKFLIKTFKHLRSLPILNVITYFIYILRNIWTIRVSPVLFYIIAPTPVYAKIIHMNRIISIKD